MQTQATESAVQQNDWALNADQMIFMMQHHNLIEAAYEEDRIDDLRELAASQEYKAIFGVMSFDEAYDRYEDMLETERDET